MDGHVIPGTSFIVFGLWWAITTLVNYRTSQSTNDVFTSTVTFDCLVGTGKCWKAPWGGILKIVATAVGVMYESYDSLKDTTIHFIDTSMVMHMTMYAFFWLTGVLDVLVYFRFPFPPAIGHVAVAIALVVEGLLFWSHLTGRREIDVIAHALLVAVVLGSAVVVMAEIKYRHSVWLSLLRSFLTLLQLLDQSCGGSAKRAYSGRTYNLLVAQYAALEQGTWFWQMTYTLSGDVNWYYEDKNLKLVAEYFCWHIGVDFVLLLFIGGFIHCIMGKYPPTIGQLSYATEDSELNDVSSRNRVSYTSDL